MMRLTRLLLSSALLFGLSACADQFKNEMPKISQECGYREQAFDVFATCVQEKVQQRRSTADRYNNSERSSVATTSPTHDLEDDFVAQLQQISQNYQTTPEVPAFRKKKIRQAIKDKRIPDQIAYDQYDQLSQQCISREEAANQKARAIGAVILVGAAGAGAIAYCQRHACGGGGSVSDSSHQGCCSWHGGITNACSMGKIVCMDGQLSPTCPCN